jgi:WD40 repeat protein
VPGATLWVYNKDRTLHAVHLPVDPSKPGQAVGALAADVVGMRTTADGGLITRDTASVWREWTFTTPTTAVSRNIVHPEGLPEGVRPDRTEQWFCNPRTEQIGMGQVWNTTGLPGAEPLGLRRRASWSQSGGCWFHPEGSWIVSSVNGYEGLVFWPLRNVYPSVVSGFDTIVKRFTFSPDGKWLASSWPGGARLWPLPNSGIRKVRTIDSPFEVAPGRMPMWTMMFDAAGENLLQTFPGQVALVPLNGDKVRRLEGFGEGDMIEAQAFSPSGRVVAAAPVYGAADKKLRLWDLETGETKVLDLPAAEPDQVPGSPQTATSDARANPDASSHEKGVSSLWFGDENTLYTTGVGGLRRWDLAAETFETIIPASDFMRAVASTDGAKVLVATADSRNSDAFSLSFHDLMTGESRSLSDLGWGAVNYAIAIDPTGRIAVTGSHDGLIRVGLVAGGQPHLLAGGTAAIEGVAISPDLGWIATGSSDGTLRLWPMPDLSKPPLHTLPQDELLATLKSLTNLRLVRESPESSDWKIEVGPFPGWKEVPTW